jgi:HPt (histidine-containing phosphotransfer) domain-containing protein
MTINISALDAYRDVMGDEADMFIADVIDTFFSSAVKLIGTLHSSLSLDDGKTFERAAHTLKSASATVGAKEMAILAADLEELSKSTPLAGLRPKVTQLGTEFEQAVADLRKIRQKLGS